MSRFSVTDADVDRWERNISDSFNGVTREAAEDKAVYGQRYAQPNYATGTDWCCGCRTRANWFSLFEYGNLLLCAGCWRKVNRLLS